MCASRPTLSAKLVADTACSRTCSGAESATRGWTSALLETGSARIRDRLKGLQFPPRRPPKLSAVDASASQFQLETFSQVFEREIGDYEALPEWTEGPDGAVVPLVEERLGGGEDQGIEGFFG